MKKKLALIISILVLSSTLTGCFPSVNNNESNSQENSSSAVTSSKPQNSEEEKPDSSTDSIDVSQPKAETNIKLASWELSKDYSGADVLVVEYEWTNTSDKDANFMTSFTSKVFQNGIECESAIMVDGVDTQKQMNDIQPGITYKLKEAFVLQDKTTANVVVKEFLGTDNLIDEKIELGGGEGTSTPNDDHKETSIKISDHKISKDYKGEDVLVVKYEFYNGESDAKGFSFMFTDKAFQNGVECDSTVIGCDDVDAQTQLNDVQPGYSYIVSVGYHLADKSDVEIKLTDLFGTKTYLDETIKLS